MNKKILFVILLGILILPSLASAQVTIQNMIDGAVQTALYIASGIVVILWIFTGVLFLMAQGEPAKLSMARKSLFTSVAGTVLVIVATGAINIVSKAFNLGF